MPYPAHVSDAAYCYDGSYAGFLCCIFESYTRREIPSAVLGPAEGQITLFGTEAIATDPTHARRVANGLTRLAWVGSVAMVSVPNSVICPSAGPSTAEGISRRV